MAKSEVTQLRENIKEINILLVDDEEGIREIFRELLSELKFPKKVFEAEDGHQALSLVKNHDFHYIFTDIKMPNMNGEVLIKKIRELQKETRSKIIAVTGSYMEKMASLDGADVHLQKPFDFDSFSKIFEQEITRKKVS